MGLCQPRMMLIRLQSVEDGSQLPSIRHLEATTRGVSFQQFTALDTCIVVWIFHVQLARVKGIVMRCFVNSGSEHPATNSSMDKGLAACVAVRPSVYDWTASTLSFQPLLVGIAAIAYKPPRSGKFLCCHRIFSSNIAKWTFAAQLHRCARPSYFFSTTQSTMANT